MSFNSTHLNENYLRDLAYQIWESEGKPEGQELRHWKLACLMVEAEHKVPDPDAIPMEPLEQLEPLEEESQPQTPLL